jgi:hypothetical protein
MEALIGLLGVIVLVFVVVCYSAFSWGFVFFKFWGWFVLPVFTFLPAINFWQALGLILVTNVISRNYSVMKEELIDEGKSWFMLVCSPWLTLLIAFVIKSIWL